VFTIAPSPLNRDLIWAGSDTGLIHLTRDGGKNWKEITPAGLSDWSKISLIEASHFDPAVAYAAVDRAASTIRRPTSIARATTEPPGNSSPTALPLRHSCARFAKTRRAKGCSSPEPNLEFSYRAMTETTGSPCN
jgi:hypothetical protein